MFANYYQHELSFLREAGQEFARRYQHTAGLLAQGSDDPDVERLLEGVAFLCSRAHARADDALPELCHTLAELLIPQYLRTIPACTVLKLEDHRAQPGSRRAVERGVEFAAPPVDGTRCTFRGSWDSVLNSFEIVGASADYGRARAPTLRIRIRANGSELHGNSCLRLFVATDYALAADLVLWLAGRCDAISVRQDGVERRLPHAHVEAAGFAPERAVLPWPELAPYGMRLLQELFSFPEKFFFLDLHGLMGVDPHAESFELIFRCPGAPPLPERLSAESFALGCTPALNLFTAPAVPIRWEPLSQEQRLRVDGLPPEHAEVFDVTSVTGVLPGRAPRRRYRPFVRMSPRTDPSGGYFVLSRAQSVVGERVETSLRVGTARERPPDTDPEALSIELLCTNADLPARVGDPSGWSATPRTPPGVSCRHISRVTRTIRPPLAGELQWRLIAHLACHHRSLGERDALQRYLSLYNFHRSGDYRLGRANERRINAISEVSSASTVRMLGGAPVRGLQTTVTCREDGFECHGDAYLFGSVLDRVFADHLPVNTFHETRVVLLPSRTEFTWRPRSGARAIL